MKKVTTLFSLIILSLFASTTLLAQGNIDPNAPFLKDKNIPKFTLNLTTGKSFSNTQIPKTKYTCIIIFSQNKLLNDFIFASGFLQDAKAMRMMAQKK